MSKRETQTNGPKNKKIEDDAKRFSSREDVDKLYVSRKERWRGLANIEDCEYASMQGLEDYIKMNEEI